MAHFSRFRHALLFLSMAGSCAAVSAGTITIPATLRGYINSRGVVAITADQDFLVAATLDDQGMVEYRDYFLFLIPNLPGPLESATLELNTYAVQIPAAGGKTFLITDTPLLFFTFNDLGTGNLYGSFNLHKGDSFETIDIPLNADALAAIQLGGFVLSGRFGDLQTGDFGQNGQLAAGTYGFFYPFSETADQAQLVLTFSDAAQSSPEPKTLLLAAAGLALLAAMARRD